MSKSKKEPFVVPGPAPLRRTVFNAPSSSRNSGEGIAKDNDQASLSKSRDSSPEEKKSKYGTPVARGSETDVIFDKDELKKVLVTIRQKVVPIKPRAVPITHPEVIMPVRRPDEGKRPIFERTDTKVSQNSKDQKTSKADCPLESTRSNQRSSRQESPNVKREGSRRSKDRSGSEKRRRTYSPASRYSSSSESSSSGDERRRKRKYRYKSDRDRERLARQRKEHEREFLQHRDRRRLGHRSSPHSNGDSSQPRFRDKNARNDRRNENEREKHDEAAAHENAAALRPRFPVRVPPPYMMRLPMRPMVHPHFPPPYPPVRFYPHPPLPFRPPPRPIPPPRGYFRL